MKAAILKNGEIFVAEVSDPTPGKGQVLVKTLSSVPFEHQICTCRKEYVLFK